jgi:hypothetical protein
MEAFRQGLREAGYVEGQNVAIELRYAEGGSVRLPELAAELVQRNANVIAAFGDRAVHVAQQATTTIPIVALTDDIVGAGLVASLARPGGNTTGVTMFAPELGPKRLELLKQIVPRVSRMAVLWDPGTPRFSFLHQPEPTRQAARHPQRLRQPAASSWITYFVMRAPGDSSGRDAHPPPRGEHPGDHEPQHVLLARGQGGEAPLGGRALGPALLAAGEAALHAGKELPGAEGVLQEIHGPTLHGADTRGHVAVAGHEDDRDVPPSSWRAALGAYPLIEAYVRSILVTTFPYVTTGRAIWGSSAFVS